MKILYIFTALSLILSVLKSRERTGKALEAAFKKFKKIFPPFIMMIITVSFVLYLLPDRFILNLLDNENIPISVMLASAVGSITFMPGFIVYPLCGLLLKKGVTYTVLSAFTTTLMMVGLLTYPIEKEYFGRKVTIIRNIISFLIALTVAFVTGIIFREKLW